MEKNNKNKISKEDWYGVISELNPDKIIPRDQQWNIQWNRLKRWYKRSIDIRKKIKSVELVIEDIDIIISFFQNCYHLRDWISNSKPNIKDKVDYLFKSYFEMRACRDICNGYKHKKLTNPSHDANFAIFREYDHLSTETNPIIYNIVFDDGDDIRKFNIFELIHKCYNIWEEFINKNI